jgi:hypothetical protein
MPRDCTDHLIKLSLDVQSPSHRVSHTMTTTKQQRQARRNRALQQITRKVQQVAIAPKKKKKATPFSDVGSIIGGGVGSMFGLPYAKGIGKWLGSGIGSIFGSGDYQMVGSQPEYNLLTNGAQIPKFSTTRQTNIVSHREYLGDITGTTAFTNRKFPINPGSAITFPWLSSIAQNYQQYKIHGLIFEFRPLITDFVTSGAPGVVVMATNYNADEPIYNTKQEMENSEYAVSVKPTCNLMHGVECASSQTPLSELYVRPGGIASNLDLKFTDLGNFQFASQGNPTQLLGELWCSYTIEFFKPILPNDIGGNIQSVTTQLTNVSNANPLGTTVGVVHGDLAGFDVTSNVISFLGQPGNYYFVMVRWEGSTGPAVLGYPGVTLTGLNIIPAFANQTVTSFVAPPPGTVTPLSCEYSGVFQVTATTASLVKLAFSGTGLLPTVSTAANVFITQVSSEMLI